MPSTPTTRKRFEKQATGDKTNTWGTDLNANVIDLVDAAISGRASYTLSGSKTLSSTNFAADEARMPFQDITGGTGGTVTIPAVESHYWFRNATSGDVVVTTGGVTTATVKSGNINLVVCDGSAVYLAMPSDFGSVIPKSSGTPSTGSHLTNKTYVDGVAFSGALPNQTGNAGKYVTTDGTTASWDALTASDISDFNAAVVAQAPAPDVQTFTANGTWTKPAGTPSTVLVICVGAGGGGGGSSGGTSGGGGGGGAGGISIFPFPASALATSVSVTVGTGGASGNAGGASSFGTYVYAGGGSAGSANSGTSGGAGGAGGAGMITGGTGGTGGNNGAAGVVGGPGSGGGGAGYSSSVGGAGSGSLVAPVSTITQAGFSPGKGGAGGGYTSAGVAGGIGSGGGGAGGMNGGSQPGGAGGNGRVAVITFY